MRVAVTGGTGTVGRLVAAELAARGHAVVALSRTRPARGVLPEGVEHRSVDLLASNGLGTVLVGFDAVVDAANAAGRRAKAVLVDGSRELGAAAAGAGVGHHALISIVGIDEVPVGYYKLKLEQEEAVRSSGAPWSILRATQFPELLITGFGRLAKLAIRPAGRARFQPIDPAVVASALADRIEAGPSRATESVAGPEIRTVGELSRAWSRETNRHLIPIPLPPIGLVRRLREGALCDESGASREGRPFEAYLKGLSL